VLYNASVLLFTLPSANDYASHLQIVTTVELYLLACQLKIIRVVMELQHNKALNII